MIIGPGKYSKDPTIPPDGIAVTWGKDMIQEKGGLLAFIRYFEMVMSREDQTWLQKCRNQPTLDIAYVYIIVCNQFRYRLHYVGHETHPTRIENATERIPGIQIHNKTFLK
jgi:hypothetical protein